MAIDPAVTARVNEVAELCREAGVKRLEVFGSATTGKFDPETSDLDFIVEFLPGVRKPWAGHYFDLRDELAQLYGRSVDLVMAGAIRNPYLRETVDASRTVLYEG